jgi:hypothetical protein
MVAIDPLLFRRDTENTLLGTDAFADHTARGARNNVCKAAISICAW